VKQKNSACVTNREIAMVVGELHKLKLAVDAGQPRPEEHEWRASIATMVGRVLTWHQTERIMLDCGFSRCDIFQSGGVAHQKRQTAEFEAMLKAVAKSVQTQQQDAKEMQRRLESFSARLLETEALYNRLAMHVNALLGKVREIGARLDMEEAGKNV
jgi:hypothetical protein